MIAVDTSAVLAIILGEPDAHELHERWLQETESVISAATVLECHLVMHGRPKIDPSEIGVLLGRMRVRIEAFDDVLLPIATEAHRQYGKGRHKASLNFGDCMSYALAKFHDVPLLCKGEDFRYTDVEIAA